jgi:hypothetical protein
MEVAPQRRAPAKEFQMAVRQYNPDLFRPVERIGKRFYFSRFAACLWNYSLMIEIRHPKAGACARRLAEKMMPPY